MMRVPDSDMAFIVQPHLPSFAIQNFERVEQLDKRLYRGKGKESTMEFTVFWKKISPAWHHVICQPGEDGIVDLAYGWFWPRLPCNCKQCVKAADLNDHKIVGTSLEDFKFIIWLRVWRLANASYFDWPMHTCLVWNVYGYLWDFIYSTMTALQMEKRSCQWSWARGWLCIARCKRPVASLARLQSVEIPTLIAF